MTMNNNKENRTPDKKWMPAIYYEFPSQFWVLTFGTFIDRIGGAMLFPFFTLYITRKFEVGMTEVGLVFALFSLSSVVGGIFGGALTDRLGRKGMLLFGLITSALSSLMMGFVETIGLFVIVTLFVGALSNTAGPAQQAMVADLLPDKKRAQGFGILRVVVNLSVTIGPMIGGLLATIDYKLLFISDAIASLITAGIVYFSLRESMSPREAESETMTQTIGGYKDVFKDVAYVWYLVASVLMVIVYMQMNTTLSVYLRDVHAIDERGFGYILSLNAAMVVLFQFPITRWVSKYRPLVVMAVGTLLYAIGFSMYGFVATYAFFLVAMVIITIGEMFVSPVGQAIVARLAPADMRGRYMAVFGFSWIIPTAVGPLLAGMVIDNFNPNWVWYGAGILGVIAALGFFMLASRASRARWELANERLDIIERVELGKLSAEEAALKLETATDSPWARLANEQPMRSRRHLRIRISEGEDSAMRMDFRLPVGLVNMVLESGGRLSSSLSQREDSELQALIAEGSPKVEGTHLNHYEDQHIEIIFEDEDKTNEEGNT